MAVTNQVYAEHEALIARLRRLPRLALWVLAARLKTLGLSVSPVLAGTVLAAQNGGWHIGVTIAAALSAMFIQTGTNLWNDAADAGRGVDTAGRLGPPRMTALGLLTAGAVRRGALACFLAASLAGLYLVSIGGWTIAAIGAMSLALGYLYSMGPFPLSATPLGEILVIAFFGIAAVCGTVWLQGSVPGSRDLGIGLFTGFPAAAVLLLNNHRDRLGDTKGGRKTLAILIGEPASRIVYCLLIFAAWAGFALLQNGGAAGLIGMVPAGLLALHIAAVMMTTPVSAALNRLIAKTALYQLLLVTGLLLAIP